MSFDAYTLMTRRFGYTPSGNRAPKRGDGYARQVKLDAVGNRWGKPDTYCIVPSPLGPWGAVPEPFRHPLRPPGKP